VAWPIIFVLMQPGIQVLLQGLQGIIELLSESGTEEFIRNR